MTLTIYGRPGSRARRPLWVARELGLAVNTIEPAPGAIKQGDYLAINPNSKVPALVDDDGFTLFESFAQSLYLAKKHGLGRLYPADAQGEALVWQWTFWAAGELERPLTTCLFERLIKPEGERDATLADAAERGLQGPLRVLDRALAGRAWILGEAFSVADINLAAVAGLIRPAGVSLADHREVDRWLSAATSRPAYSG